MTLLAILDHVLNFGAPALAMALLMPLGARFLIKRRGIPFPWWAQFAANFVVGVCMLAGSFWIFGRDGKMQAYAALVLAVATSQWLLSRGWRR
jgi:hypothetical protein